VHRTGPDLDLLRRPVLEQLTGLDPLYKVWCKGQDSVQAQHVGHEVVGEQRQPRDVVKHGRPGPSEVRGGDLRTLEESERELLIGRAVGERGPAAEPLGRCASGSAGAPASSASPFA
jgi:hypothetical protein